MTLFLVGLIIFFGAHLFTGLARGARGALVAKLGEMPYKGLYSLVSLAGFVLIIIGWKTADASVLYVTPAWTRHITYLLVLIAFILLAAAYLPAGKIAAAAKHPMLAGVKLWAFAHLLVNGEVRSVILFGAFLAYGVIDRIAVKKRGETGRAAGPVMNDGLAVVVGAGAYAAIAFWAHKYIAGVALF
ncbi:NnrU family protein [Hyphococcus luteus]|uniref:NnrU family protein n=1 Tax=Hyphococcus luteus TaxID=2058213 RepID=A0A2S7K2W9_9PROT|nr:NnrU family protein [Marinicaulis flavus]PQA86837.1 NnrU family protein [Marinicaulis flavus]